MQRKVKTSAANNGKAGGIRLPGETEAKNVRQEASNNKNSV